MFQLDSTTRFTWGRDEIFQIFWTIVNSSHTKWALYSIIYSANLTEFEVVLKSVAKKKNTKKFGEHLESCISGTAGPIPFKFDT